MSKYYSPLAGQNPYTPAEESPLAYGSGGLNNMGGRATYDKLQQRLAYEWLNANALSSGEQANPPFLSSAAGRLHPAVGNDRIVRGYVRRATYDAADPVSGARLYFMYNPETIVRDYVSYLDQAALDPFNTVYGSQNLIAPPSFMNFSFELFFDRQEEVAGDGDHPGVFVDYQFFDLVVRNVIPGSSATSNQLPDNGVMMVNPKDITVVFSPQITVQGRPINAQVRFEKFSHKMTPIRMRIALEMRVLYVGPLRQFEMDQTAGLIGSTQQTVDFFDSSTLNVTNNGLLGFYSGVPSLTVGLTGPTFDEDTAAPVITPIVDNNEAANDNAKRRVNAWLRANTHPNAIWVTGKDPKQNPYRLYDGKVLYTACSPYVRMGYKMTVGHAHTPSGSSATFYPSYGFKSYQENTLSTSTKYNGKLIMSYSADNDSFTIKRSLASKGVMTLSQARAWFNRPENLAKIKEGDLFIKDRYWTWDKNSDGTYALTSDGKRKHPIHGHIFIFSHWSKDSNGVTWIHTLEAAGGRYVGQLKWRFSSLLTKGGFNYIIRPYPLGFGVSTPALTSVAASNLVGTSFSESEGTY